VNVKIIKVKNNEFRLKLETWKKRFEERKRHKKRCFENSKKLKEVFHKLNDDFTIEKEKVLGCLYKFNKMLEDKEKVEKEERIINDFLITVPETLMIEIKDLQRTMTNDSSIFQQDMKVLRDFITVIKSECVLNSYYFSFYDIPDLIVKKKYQRKDYDLIMSLLTRVKKIYLL